MQQHAVFHACYDRFLYRNMFIFVTRRITCSVGQTIANRTTRVCERAGAKNISSSLFLRIANNHGTILFCFKVEFLRYSDCNLTLASRPPQISSSCGQHPAFLSFLPLTLFSLNGKHLFPKPGTENILHFFSFLCRTVIHSRYNLARFCKLHKLF